MQSKHRHQHVKVRAERQSTPEQLYVLDGFRSRIQHKIGLLMSQKNVSAGEVCRQIGNHSSYLTYIMSEEANPTIRKLSEIFSALGEECVLVTRRKYDQLCRTAQQAHKAAAPKRAPATKRTADPHPATVIPPTAKRPAARRQPVTSLQPVRRRIVDIPATATQVSVEDAVQVRRRRPRESDVVPSLASTRKKAV